MNEDKDKDQLVTDGITAKTLRAVAERATLRCRLMAADALLPSLTPQAAFRLPSRLDKQVGKAVERCR